MSERVASLISGGGTTMNEVGKACLSGQIHATLACVIASTPEAGGIKKALSLGVKPEDVLVINPENFRPSPTSPVNQEAFGQALLIELTKRDISVVLQNGWLPLTPKALISEFEGRIFNQHPGPVPEFGGKGMFGRRVHAAVLLFRRMTKSEPWSEVIAQRVAEKFDAGAVIKSRRVYIKADDTVEDLQQRALPVEHELQVELLSDFVEGRLKEAPAREPIVSNENQPILERAKEMARLLYPKG